jgi:hypothetical protein
MPKLHTLAVPESLLRTAQENGQLQEPFELLPTVSDSRVASDLPPPSTSSPLLSMPPSMTLSTPVPTLLKTQLRTPKSTPEQKLKNELEGLDRLLKDLHAVYGISDLGKLFHIFLYVPPKGTPDPRSKKHISVASSFLAGQMTFRPLHLVDAMYTHHYGTPSWRAESISARLWQKLLVGSPGSKVAVRPKREMLEGRRPTRKVPMNRKAF